MKINFNNKQYELIVLHVAGSRLYGNSTKSSDWDYRGIVIESNESKIGLFDSTKMLGGETGKGKSGEQLYNCLIEAGLKLNKTDDIQLYELKNFTKLAIDNNPNILDTLCYDYNTKATVYITDLAKNFLDNRELFLSKKMRYTFSGYAISQLKKIKSHHKWIAKFPKTSDILSILKFHFENKKIDYMWIVDNFGGRVAKEITGESPENYQKFNCISRNVFFRCHDKNFSEFAFYKLEKSELEKYMIPQMIDYIKAYDLKAKVLDKDEEFEISFNQDIEITTIRRLLTHRGSFRELGGSILNIFTNGSGIFDNHGSIKKHHPEHVGTFVCSVIIDKNQYQADLDEVQKMWKWKIERNKDRSLLEDKHGYDTKHASHLFRLMLCSKDVMSSFKYVPELSGEKLKTVKEVRSGKYSYSDIVEFAEKSNDELNILYKKSTLQNKAQIKKINQILISILNRGQ